MSKPPREPYPPDPEDDATRIVDFGDLVDAVVADVDWANVRGLRWSAQRATFERCRLTGAELAEATLQDVRFSDCRIDLAGLRHSQLQRVIFSDCRMGECDFAGARLEDVLFERCELTQASFAGVSIERVDLGGCDLAGLVGAEALRGVRMPWDDALQAGPVFATALGIELLD